MTHLGADAVRLLSTADLNPLIAEFSNNLTNVMCDVFTGDMWAAPWLGDARSRRTVMWSEWWQTETMFSMHAFTVSRRDLVLWAVNKDGGAHADADPGVDYARVREAWNFTFTLGKPDGSKVVTKIRDLHLSALRQQGYEVLNSPELLALAGR